MVALFIGFIVVSIVFIVCMALGDGDPGEGFLRLVFISFVLAFVGTLCWLVGSAILESLGGC